MLLIYILDLGSLNNISGFLQIEARLTMSKSFSVPTYSLQSPESLTYSWPLSAFSAIMSSSCKNVLKINDEAVQDARKHKTADQPYENRQQIEITLAHYLSYRATI